MEGFNWSNIIWLAVAIGVYLFGIWEGRGKGYKQRKAEEEQEHREKQKPAPPPETIKVDDPGLLRIKNENGIMTLDLDGQRVQPTALTADQRKRLIEMLNVMRPWLEGRPAAVPAPAVPPPSKPSTVPTQDNPAPAPIADFAPPPAMPVYTAPAKPGKKKDEELEVTPTSIVGQINVILQRHINNTPLGARGVTLMESPSGGVNVFVGVQRFEAIDDVPDDEVKGAIRAAIAEWEKKYTPG